MHNDLLQDNREFLLLKSWTNYSQKFSASAIFLADVPVSNRCLTFFCFIDNIPVLVNDYCAETNWFMIANSASYLPTLNFVSI